MFFASIASGQDAIEDNSFLIEEAYNQEKGVIQYINTFQRSRRGDWLYTFTNEIPVKKQQYQFSYTVPVARVGGKTNVGDVLVNYSYQAAGLKEKDKVAVAPRFSLILPTDSYHRGSSSGAVGFQFNLPVSVKHFKKVVTHCNASATFTPRARNTGGQRATAKGVNLGHSTVFLAKSKFNLHFETAGNYNDAVTGAGRTAKEYSLLLNPGVRWAWNLKSGWQVVPGVAVPIGAGPSYGERGVFLYFSLEK